MQNKPDVDAERRGFLGLASTAGLGALAGAVGCLEALAQTSSEQPKLAQAGLIKRNHAKELWALKPARLDFRAPYDLADPIGNWHAVMKVSNNPTGGRTYVSNYARTFLCPENRPAVPFYGACGAWTHQLVESTPEILAPFGKAPEGTLMLLALYTSVVLDPFTFKPVQRLQNPVTGKEIIPEDSVYAESYLIYPGGGMLSLERPDMVSDTAPQRAPYVRSGRNISFNLAALFAGNGLHQPRMDASWWTSSYADLMNPNVVEINADYNWTGLMKARERPWWGFAQSDNGQVLWNVKGTVAKQQSAIEPIVQEYVFNKYPDRV